MTAPGGPQTVVVVPLGRRAGPSALVAGRGGELAGAASLRSAGSRGQACQGIKTMVKTDGDRRIALLESYVRRLEV